LSEYLRSCQLQSRTAARTKCDTHGGEGFSLIGVDLFFLECYSLGDGKTLAVRKLD
jgi:hypothetical protein